MDQYINIFGKCGNVLRIDCRSLDCEYYPFENSNISLVLFDTCISHALASTEYNQRKIECNKGIETIKKIHPHVESLRDVSMEMLSEYGSKMDSTIFRRCKYVVEENERVLAACDALKAKDLKAFGQYMYKTHHGLSNDYEVSCKELDYLVELVKDNPHVYGSRMMGGGFGGCTINLIESDEIDQISRSVVEMYSQRFRSEPKTYVTSISSGTSIIRMKEHATV
jgi:galactokinase